MACSQEEFFFSLVINPLGVFDDQTVHIGDPKRTVRTGCDVGRAKPTVARSEELTQELVLGSLALKSQTVGFQSPAVH